MKRSIVFVVMVLCALMMVACNKGNDKEIPTDSPIQGAIPPKIDAEAEILEIDGHVVTVKVIKSRTTYCKTDDILSGELENFDWIYDRYPFKVGDIVNIWSDIDSVTETEIKFDSLIPIPIPIH